MNRYSVQIADRALSDMQAIYEYIAETLLAPESAMNQYDRIADAAESLAEFPERCRVLDSCMLREVRLMPVDNYSVLYTITNSDVIILRVLYSASDITAILRNSD